MNVWHIFNIPPHPPSKTTYTDDQLVKLGFEPLSKDWYWFEYFEALFIWNYLASSLLSLIFFSYLALTVVYNHLGDYSNRLVFKNLFVYQYWIFLLSVWFFFIYKIEFVFSILKLSFGYIPFLFGDFIDKKHNNILGDTLIILCVTTIIISWVFLSERYINLNIHNSLYFFIFIIFTINMVYTTNLLTMFIFFELIFLPSLFFVYVLGYSKKVEKTIKYLLLWTLTGSFIVLFTIVYLHSVVGSLEINSLYLIKFTSKEKIYFYFLFFVGFGVKIPLWPFHFWLTKVHVEAPTGFSIFLSGYLVKTALFCFMQCIAIFKNEFLVYISMSWVAWGCLDASIRMWSATDIKRLIAFATIQEMNLIIILFLLSNNTSFKILNSFIFIHGLLSSLLFFLVDQVQKRCQTRNLTNLSGLAYKVTILPIIIWLALLIFRGFPIFSKFLIEWEILTLLIENYNFFGLFFFVIITVFSVLGFARIWFTVLYGQPSTNINVGVDMLKTDQIIALFIIFQLFFISTILLYFSFSWLVLH